MHSSKLKLVFLTLTALILPAFCFQACDAGSYVREDGMVWNTTYHITFKGNPVLRDSVLVVLNDVGKSLNVFDSASLVSRVNSADSMKVDSRFIKVYNASRLINSASEGMFDPTLSPLITAWGFGPGHKLTADTIAIDSILNYVGIGKTRLEGDKIIKDDPRIQFNFSAVAKGYGCDEVAAMFTRNGVTDYLVEIGGEIAVCGKNPGGGLWSVSIDRPIQTDSTVNHDACGVIHLTNAGIATSGNYRNFKKEGGKTLGHTISPLTGRPIATDVISATVIAPTAMEADATATACMASGSQKSKTLLQRLRFEGMLILSDSTIWMTPGFKKMTIEG